jgi:hypothetical protein
MSKALRVATTASRLLIGVRPWPEFTPLLDLAHDLGKVLDLDTIPAQQRRQDIADYVTSLLELLPGYATTAHNRGRRAFASTVADTLVTDQPQSSTAHVPITDQAGERWGEFLVAALYTHTISVGSPYQISDPLAATQLGSSVPRTLPEVLELDLATRPESVWRRPVLTALAHARGNGMPRSVLPMVTAAIAEEPIPPSAEQVSAEPATVRFYLRTSADSDGATLYRLFHQGLADHLRTGGHTGDSAEMAGRVLAGLLATAAVANGGVRRWDLTAPYLLRHAIQHAAEAGQVDQLLVDQGLLVHADLVTLIPALQLANSEQARLAAAVYRVSAGKHPWCSPDQRRHVLAVDAARYRAWTLRDDGGPNGPPAARSTPRFALPSPATPARWRRWPVPCWRVDPSPSPPARMARCGCGTWPPLPRSGTRSPATPARWRRWRAP